MKKDYDSIIEDILKERLKECMQKHIDDFDEFTTEYDANFYCNITFTYDILKKRAEKATEILYLLEKQK
jgi:ribulose 1,5-bisphosphate carboxylase large subunit-like protein